MLQSAIFSHKTMKNAIFSCLSSYSYSNSGCNEVMTETPSISSNLVFNDDSLCFYGDFSSNHDQSSYNVLVPGSTENSQGGTQFSYMPVQDDIFYQPWESSYVQPSYNEIHFIQNAGKKDVSEKNIARKRSAEAGGSCSLTKSATNERDQLKKRPAHFQGKLSNIQKEKEPKSRRRSQKLTDKITALQKLVSPYGKTDTASVLLEASISINALQDQIEEIFHNISGERTTNMTGDKRSDLQSRGLSLVPTGILEELDKRLPIHCHHH